MLPIILLGGAVSTLLFLNRKKEEPAPRHAVGFAETQPRVPGKELLELWGELLATEERPDILRLAAGQFQQQGYEREAQALSLKARSVARQPTSVPRAEPPPTAGAKPPQTAGQIAAELVATAQQKGGWYWNMELVRAFQSAVKVPVTGIFDAATLGAMSVLAPGSENLWVNSGIRPMHAMDRTTEPSPIISSAEIAALFASPEYALGIERAKAAA